MSTCLHHFNHATIRPWITIREQGLRFIKRRHGPNFCQFLFFAWAIAFPLLSPVPRPNPTRHPRPLGLGPPSHRTRRRHRNSKSSSPIHPSCSKVLQVALAWFLRIIPMHYSSGKYWVSIALRSITYSPAPRSGTQPLSFLKTAPNLVLTPCWSSSLSFLRQVISCRAIES